MAPTSLKFNATTRFGETEASRTEYILGRNTRSESRGRANILNRDLRYRFEVDLDSRMFTAFRTNDYGSPKWVEPRLTRPLKQSGRTVHNHTETIDTGDRKQFFGFTARHVVTRIKSTRDSEVLSESEYDGWYIDPPAAWLNVHPPSKPGVSSYLISGTADADDYTSSATGEAETGFAAVITRKCKFFSYDETGTARIHETLYREEITDLSEAPLESDLFVPPRGFKRVSHFPSDPHYRLAYRARLRWELLKDSLTLAKRIASFTA